MSELKTFLFRRLSMLLVLAMLVTMLPIAVPVSAVEAADYPVLELDTQTTVTIQSGALTYLAFTPEFSCTYEFYSVYGTSTGSSSSDTYGYLYDSDFNRLTSDDDGKGDLQFRIVWALEAGKTYYLGVRFYSSSYSGTFDVMATAKHSFATEIEQEATCSVPGVKRYTCTGCGYSYNESYLEAHTYEDGFCTACGAGITDGGSCGDSVTWNLVGNELTISGTGAMYNYNSGSMPWYEYRNQIKSVVIESGVTSVGDYAFYNHRSITSVRIAEGCTSIGNRAFYRCESLLEMIIPQSCTSIGYYAFYDCTALRSVEIPGTVASIGENAFYGCSNLESLTLHEGITEIGINAFSSCTKLSEVVLPQSLTTIGRRAFAFCSTLTQIHIPAAVTEIAEFAFNNCSNLERITVDAENPVYYSDDGVLLDRAHENTLQYPAKRAGTYEVPDGFTEIGEYAFSYATELTAVTLPDTVTRISDRAFYYCTGLETIDFPESLTAIFADAFASCESLIAAELPDSVKTIGSGAFANCYMLSSLHLPENLNDIWKTTFENCYSLTHVEIPDQVTRIGDHAFYNCTGLESVKMPENLESMYWYSFSNCSAVTELTIPATVNWIAQSTYWEGFNCNDLLAVTFEGNAPAISSDVFKTSTFTAYYPAGNSTWNEETLKNYGGSVTWIPYGDEDLVASGTCNATASWVLRSDYVLTISGTGTVADRWQNYANVINSVVVEDGITEIADRAFDSCATLNGIRFLGDAPAFGENAFAGTSVIAFYPADNATWTEEVRQSYGGTVIWSTLEDGALLGSGQCGDNVTWELDTTGTLTISGEGAMWDYTETQPEWSDYDFFISSVVVEEGVTTIGDYAMSDFSKVNNVQLPDSVFDIGYCSFWNCGKLAQVELPEQLDSIDGRAFLGTGLTSLEIPESVTSLGGESLGSCNKLDQVRFFGDAPAFGYNVFSGDNLIAYYPMGNETWTEDVLQDHGGSVTWKAIGPNNELAMGTCGDDLSWAFYKNGTLHITGTGPMYDYSYIYSEEDDAVFAPWKPYFSSITRIVMDEGITAIGDYAFQGIYYADNTVIPSTVEVIGGRAFNSHTFTDLVIPEGVRVIEEYAFVYGEISTVSFPSTLEVVGEGVFEWTSIEKVYIPSMEDWMEIQFDDFFSTPFADYGSTDLYVDGVLTTEIIVPESITEIHDSQFEFFSSLSGVQFHDGVTRIGDYAFGMSPSTGFNAENFREVTIPASVEYIGDYAFRRCACLGDVYILNPECAFGEDAFSDCNAYDENGNYVQNVVTIHGYAGSTAEAYAETWGYNFERLPAQEVASGWSGETTWSLTDDGVITFSGEGTMRNYTYNSEMPWYGYFDQITAVVIEEGVTSIGTFAFYGMDIESVEIPSTVTTIGDYAFKNAKKLDGVILPEGLTRLGESAFYECTALTAIDIPASLWTVQPYTFKNCTALAEVSFHEGNLQKISDGAFYNTALTELILPDCLSILDVYSFKNCSGLESIMLGDGLTEIREAVFYGTAISEITIPEGITKIGPYAFKNCVALEAAELPDTLTLVDEAAFYACTALNSIEFPDSVTKIGDYAFRKCEGLETVSFGEGLEEIGESSFYGCTGLTEVVIPDAVSAIRSYAFKGCTSLAQLQLGQGLVTIGDSAFHTCTSLSALTFPASVGSIGDYCFSGSYNLWQLTFEGDAPAIGTSAFKGMVANAWYPAGNATWTADQMLNYGGTITWIAR